MNNLATLYETDFYAWTLESIHLLKNQQYQHLDVEHLIEEIKSMGVSERRELENRLIELMLHLLKWNFQPERQNSSWKISIAKQRIGIEKILQDNPSLKYQNDERIQHCYQYARRYAAIETQLSLTDFPEICPYSTAQILDFEFLPLSRVL